MLPCSSVLSRNKPINMFYIIQSHTICYFGKITCLYTGLCASSLRVSPGHVCRTFCAPARFHDANLNVKASPETLKIVSLDTANSAQVVKYNISEAVGKYKSHPTDTGSTSVQGISYALYCFQQHSFLVPNAP